MSAFADLLLEQSRDVQPVDGGWVIPCEDDVVWDAASGTWVRDDEDES